jgi:anionic cell wall polymer biosynthesis LytR-Cps2A-Psr (LCP) family protein
MIDFDGFKGLTEALHGVPVTSNIAFSAGPYSYAAGPNMLSGANALAFVRERYAFPDGDYQRVRNQQAFIKGVIAKTINAETLSNPITINNLVNVFSPFVAVDKTLDAAALGSLALELQAIRPQDMTMFTLPTRGTGTSADGQSIVLVDPDAIQKISAALAEDKLGDYITANNFLNGN